MSLKTFLFLLSLAPGLRAAEAPQPLSPAAETSPVATAVSTPVPTEQATPAAEQSFEDEGLVIRATKVGRTASKLDVPLYQVPASVNVIKGETLREQGANEWTTAMRNVPGAFPLLTYGAFNAAVVRGLPGNNLVVLYDGVRDETNQIYGSSPLSSLESIERVETLRGPASIVYGQGATAGVVNFIRKKPSDKEAYEFGVSLGQFDTYRAHLGAQGLVPCGDMKYRLDLGVSENTTFRGANNRRSNVSFSLGSPLWEGAETLVSVFSSHDYFDTDAGIPVDPVTFRVRPGSPLNRRYNTPNDHLENWIDNVSWELSQVLGDWELNNKVSFVYDAYDYLSAETLALLAEPSTTVTRGYFYFGQDRRALNNSLELRGQVEAAGRHKLLLGYDVSSVEDRRNNFFGPFGTGLPALTSIDLINPVETAARLNNIQPNRRVYKQQITQSGVFQDFYEPHEKLKFLVGARYDSFLRGERFEKLNQAGGTLDVVSAYPATSTAISASTWRGGLILEPMQGWSLYAAQSTAFRPIYVADDVNGKLDWQPETGEMFEAGQKLDLLNGRLSFSAIYFDLWKSNILVNLGTVPAGVIYSQAGSLRSQGAETELAYESGTGWGLTGGYAYTYASYYSFVTDWNATNDKTKNFSGNRPSFAPVHSATLWGTRRWASGFGLGFGGRYVDEVFAADRNHVLLPGYSVLNAAIFYKAGDGDLTVNLDNVLDKRDYFVSAIRGTQLYPGDPRTLMVSYRKSFQ